MKSKHSSKKSGAYYLYGLHPVQAALDNPRRQKGILRASENALKKLKLPKAMKVETIQPKMLDKLFHTAVTHQGVALEVKPLDQPFLPAVLGNKKHLLMLDQVTDPHNIGAIMRSAAAFDIGAVIVQERHAPEENAIIAKTAAGGLESIPLIHETNLSRTIKQCQESGYWAVGLTGHTPHLLNELKADQPILLVMGAEGKGLRRLVAENCDQLCKLPIHPQMESLNVSVAAGIGMFSLYT